MMNRMFHIICDNPTHYLQAADELGDVYYAEEAVIIAKGAGYHLRNYSAICPECWASGCRFTKLGVATPSP